MYEGNLIINEDNAVPLLSLAELLQVDELVNRINTYLLDGISKSSVFNILKKALTIKTNSDLIGRCILVIARNFSHMYTSSNNLLNLDFLPVDLFIELLKNESLLVSNEFWVFKTICNYLSSQYPNEIETEVPVSIRYALFEHVRFPYMKYEELEEVIKEKLVPKELLIEALMIRIANHENPEKSKSNITRLQRRSTIGRVFQYNYDFDDQGILYYIGTKGGSAKWRNPCLMEFGVKITSSSIERGNPIEILGRKATSSEVWTKDVPSSWICLDLGVGRSLIITQYTLRHGGLTPKQDNLRNWVLQASDDCQNWIVISRHSQDDSLTLHSTFTWTVTTCTRNYRYFRILQTGHNASNNNFLSLSGIELYGELYDTVSYT